MTTNRDDDSHEKSKPTTTFPFYPRSTINKATVNRSLVGLNDDDEGKIAPSFLSVTTSTSTNTKHHSPTSCNFNHSTKLCV